MTRRFLTVATVLALTSHVALAHGTAAHVLGTVIEIKGKSVTVQTADKTPKMVTFTVADHTEIDKGDSVASLSDLKVGDRVLVEIPKGKTEAESIKIGVFKPLKPLGPAEHQHKR